MKKLFIQFGPKGGNFCVTQFVMQFTHVFKYSICEWTASLQEEFEDHKKESHI